MDIREISFEVSAADLVANLVPPPHFLNVRFSNYIPDSNQPTQSAALAALKEFSTAINTPKKWWQRSESLLPGRYLDGGFGVGKTHLLASLWHEVQGQNAFGTFVEYTNLVGALGFERCVEELSNFKLVCIDEFELDDPGDTVLMSTLLMRLVQNGVKLAATSNTLPERLGEERFAAEDFAREIQGLSAHFETLRINGDDYRHRDLSSAPEPLSEEDLSGWVSRTALQHRVIHNSIAQISEFLKTLHPSKFHKLVEQFDLIAISDVEQLDDQATALRWVVFIDRLYDLDIPVRYSGESIDRLFSENLLKSGYRKKYRRALSRIVSLATSSDS
ncbi:MAG: hypothetical protein RL038_1062 [Actinomycetota bacterium]